MRGGDGVGWGCVVRAVALVSCVKQKRGEACRAEKLYTSALFAKASTYARAVADEWYILSAKYGLVRPDDVIEPYEQTLNEASAAERRAWAERVHGQMREVQLFEGEPKLVWLAGAKYRADLAKRLRGVVQVMPLEGKRIGEQLQWYTELPRRIDGLLATVGEGGVDLPRFVEAAYAHGWVTQFDWPAWQTEAERFVEDPELVCAAEVSEVERLITVHVRKERFCEGHLEAMVGCGHVGAVVGRVAVIRSGV